MKEETMLSCPKCQAARSVRLEKRTCSITHVPIKKDELGNYFSCLSQDFENYGLYDGHISESNFYEKLVLVCSNCGEEFEYACRESFNEEDEEFNSDKLKELGFNI